MRILIVEDEEKLARLLKRGLEKEGYAVDYLTEGAEAERRISLCRKEYDIIVLDLMLPGKDGFEICKSIREKNIMIPILVLTARGGEEDKITMLDIGADDYLVKPFSFNEFFARIRALLRRPAEALPEQLKISDVTLDPKTRTAYVSNKEIPLTLKEYSLLEYLMRHPNQVLSREQIYDHVWDFNSDSFSNVVDVHIKNIRNKLHDRYGENLETIRGVGYRFKG